MTRRALEAIDGGADQAGYTVRIAGQPAGVDAIVDCAGDQLAKLAVVVDEQGADVVVDGRSLRRQFDGVASAGWRGVCCLVDSGVEPRSDAVPRSRRVLECGRQVVSCLLEVVVDRR